MMGRQRRMEGPHPWVKKMRTSAREVPQVETGGRHLRHLGQTGLSRFPGLSGRPGWMEGISAGSTGRTGGIYAERDGRVESLVVWKCGDDGGEETKLVASSLP